MQEWIVAIIVACAAWVVVKRYMPKTVTHTVRMQIARAAKKLGWSRIARKFELQTQTAACADGCSTCGGCGSQEAPPVEKQSATMVKILRRAGPR